MKKKPISFFVILSLLVSVPLIPSNAIENGSDALDNSIVVQIKLNFLNYSTGCSGALLAPRIVVTADHCIKLVGDNNKNNLIQSAIVAPAGAARDIQTSFYVNVTDFIFTPREGKNGAAFLVLESPLELKLPVKVASASDIDSLQSNKSPIKFVGYGTTDKNQTVYRNFPQIAEGELFKDLDNSRVHLRSNPGAPCAGDSGGPVIQQLEGEILLIGVVQGPWYLDGKTFCPIEIWNPEGVRQDNVYKYSVYIPLYTPDAISDAKLAADKVLASPTKAIATPTSDCRREGQRVKVSGLDYICTDNGVALVYLPQEKANEFIAAKKKMEDFYTKTSELRLRLNSAESAANTLQLKKLIKVTIKDISLNVDFHKNNKINPFDYLGATTQMQLYETRSEAIFDLIKKQKLTVTCIKGSVKKQVSGKSPKCPAGYKRA